VLEPLLPEHQRRRHVDRGSAIRWGSRRLPIGAGDRTAPERPLAVGARRRLLGGQAAGVCERPRQELLRRLNARLADRLGRGGRRFEPYPCSSLPASRGPRRWPRAHGLKAAATVGMTMTSTAAGSGAGASSPRSAPRGSEHASGVGRWRWVLERDFAWFHDFGRMCTCCGFGARRAADAPGSRTTGL
jgi:hypothetical protein